MKNKNLNFFQRRTVPIGFKEHEALDNFIQHSLDKFTFSDPLNEMYDAAGVYSRYIISDKSTIPDLIIYNKTFNKNDCFENCSSRAFNSFPRFRFILNTQKKEKYPKRNNNKKRQYEFKEVKDDREFQAKSNEKEEEPEWGNDDITEFKKSKIVFQAIPTSNTGEEEKGKVENFAIIEKEEEIITKQLRPLDQDQSQGEKSQEVKQEDNTIISHNEELKKLVTQSEEIIFINGPINRSSDNKETSEINDHLKEEETFLTNPKNFLAQIQENQKKMKEKEMNRDKIFEEITKCKDIFKVNDNDKEKEKENDNKEDEIVKKDIIKEQLQIKLSEPSNQSEDNQLPNSKAQNTLNKPIAQPMLPPQGGDFSKMPFIPGVPPYMCYPFLQPFPMPPSFNYPVNQMMNPMMHQMGLNMNANMMPPYHFEDEDEEEDDPMMNNFNDNFHRYNPTVFLENPALIVKKNLIESNWFIMKDNKILGNYNSEQLLFFLGEQIRQQNKFDGISITDYHTDVFFKPNNLFDILRKNVPKLKKKYIQNTIQMMAMPMINNNMMPNINFANSNSNSTSSGNREGNINPHTIQNRPMNPSKTHPSSNKK